MDKITIFLIFITGLTVVLTLHKVLDRYVVHQNDLKTNVFAGETETFPFENTNPNKAEDQNNEQNSEQQTGDQLLQENESEFEKIFQEDGLQVAENDPSSQQENPNSEVDSPTFDEIFSDTSGDSNSSDNVNGTNNSEDSQRENSSTSNNLTASNSSHSPANTGQQLPSSFISLTLLEKVGFRNVILQRIPFSGRLFDEIDLVDGLSLDIVVQNVLRNNSTIEATFYHFLTKSHLLADEVYKLLKQKASVQENLFVNETNQFGNGSFYVNFSEEKNIAFLVVKKGESVYALSYKKSYHAFIKLLLQLLP